MQFLHHGLYYLEKLDILIVILATAIMIKEFLGYGTVSDSSKYSPSKKRADTKAKMAPAFKPILDEWKIGDVITA